MVCIIETRQWPIAICHWPLFYWSQLELRLFALASTNLNWILVLRCLETRAKNQDKKNDAFLSKV